MRNKENNPHVIINVLSLTGSVYIYMYVHSGAVIEKLTNTKLRTILNNSPIGINFQTGF